jgi:hypothetical protein
MSRTLRRVAATAMAAVALVVASSCSSSTSPSLTAADLQGTYDLLTFQAQGQPQYTPTTVPAAVGVLTLTLTTYDLALTIGGAPQPDNGTYTVNGSTFSQTSATTTLTYTGTASLSSTGLLNVSVSTPAGLVTTTFQKR